MMNDECRINSSFIIHRSSFIPVALNMLLDKVKKTIARFQMLRPHDRVLVAVSGGPDSIALLFILNALKDDIPISLTVAHMNHQLRGVESDGDEEFVKRVAEGLSLKCLTRSVNIRQYASTYRLNLEEAGRWLRREFLKAAAAAAASTRIAMGHTLNDQAETVLMRLVRGSGAAGLSAIHPVVRLSDSLSIIRPLIEVSRKEILQFLTERSLAYRMDISNQDLHFTRNRVRAELLPYLAEHFNIHIFETLARYADLAREDESFLNALARRIASDVLKEQDAEIHLKITDLYEHPRALQYRILREALKRVIGSLRRVRFSHVESILQLAEPTMSGKQINLPFGLIVRREFSELVFAAGAKASTPFCYRLPIPGSVDVEEAGCRIEATIVERESIDLSLVGKASTVAIFDSRCLSSELIVRNRLPGDRYPMGGGRYKKVKELMIEKKIPRSRRDTLPVLVAFPRASDEIIKQRDKRATGSDIFWIPGFSVPKPYRPTSSTDRYGLIKVTEI